ncbi:MAG TPA: hypothetical protein VGM06_01745 [Polyangiaceae bacterium]|jgi:hypothetical protein
MLRIAFMAASAALVACSSSPAAPSMVPADGATLDPSLVLVNLSPAQQAEACDWAAQQYGGYGHMAVCDAGTMAGNTSGPGTDQATCVMGVQQFASARPTCPATVGDDMACVQWEIQNPCAGTATGPTGCQVLASTACAQ